MGGPSSAVFADCHTPAGPVVTSALAGPAALSELASATPSSTPRQQVFTSSTSPVRTASLVPSMQGVSTPTLRPCLVPPASPQPADVPTPRRSTRHPVAKDGATLMDEDSLTKAMCRKALQNAQLTPGMSAKSMSFASFSTPQLSSRLFNVGVSLGRNEKEVLISANALRHIEVDRTRVTPNMLSRPIASSLDEDEATDNVNGQLLSHLVGEVSEVGLDETGLGSIYDLQASCRKSKNASAKKNQRSSKLTKPSKSPKVSR